MSRITIIILLSVLFMPSVMKAQSIPKTRFGVEWGYIGTFYSGYHYNFFAPEGYRIDIEKYGFKYNSNAEAYFHLDYECNPKLTVSFYLGISALDDFHHILPISVRATRFYTTETDKDRWFSFVDIGSGISLKSKPQEILTGKIGGGYRIALSKSTSLDLLMAIRASYTHPDIYYSENRILPDKINRNNAFISALSIGIALTY